MALATQVDGIAEPGGEGCIVLKRLRRVDHIDSVFFEASKSAPPKAAIERRYIVPIPIPLDVVGVWAGGQRRLADLLRLSLDLRDRQEVTLREEMELTEAYLAIQRIRFGQRLEVSVRIDPSALDARVPTMILQPLVENAVDHGIARRATTGHVELTADCEGERLRIVVRDDGPGLDGKALNEGVGLANTRERLEQIHGDRASLQVRSRDGGGVEAELWIPLRPS